MKKNDIDINKFSKEYLKKVADVPFDRLDEKYQEDIIKTAMALEIKNSGKKALTEEEIKDAIEKFKVLCALEYLTKDGLLIGKGEGFNRKFENREK